MALSRVEKERLTDSRQKIQSVARSLREIDPDQIPDYEAIESCLEDANRSLGRALRSSGSPTKK